MTTNNEYLVGDLVNVTTGPGFLNELGVAVDPTTLTLTVGVVGSAAIVTATFGVGNLIVKASTGNYYANLDTTAWPPEGAPGTRLVYWYKWTGTGTAQAVSDQWFGLTDSPI